MSDWPHASKTLADGCVIHVGKKQRVELLDVVDEVNFEDGWSAVRACLRVRHRLKLVFVWIGRAVTDVNALKSAGPQKVLKRVGVQRPDMGDVANVAREEREPARGIDRLQDDLRAGSQFVIRSVEKLHEVVRVKVLNDLRRKKSSEGFVGYGQQIGQAVANRGLESALTTDRRHFIVQVDTARRYAACTKQI